MIHEEQESESPLQSTRTVWLMPEDASNGGHLRVFACSEHTLYLIPAPTG